MYIYIYIIPIAMMIVIIIKIIMVIAIVVYNTHGIEALSHWDAHPFFATLIWCWEPTH